MRTLLVLGLTTLGLSLACAVQPSTESESEETAQQGAALNDKPPVDTVVNCDSPANYSCFECGNHDGVMCCVGNCVVIPRPKYPRK